MTSTAREVNEAEVVELIPTSFSPERVVCIVSVDGYATVMLCINSCRDQRLAAVLGVTEFGVQPQGRPVGYLAWLR